MSGFRKATRASSFLRMGLVGPSGSGKTMTAVRVGKGLAGDGRVAVIDTERKSASLYADLDFDVMELPTFEVERFIDAISDAAKAGYRVLVIDSLSHAWAGPGGILEFVDKTAKRGGGGGNFSAWRDATPLHNRLVDAILSAPMHVICTLRAKTEYVVENVGGRNTVRKIGMQPVQRDGVEYEFTIVGDMTADHDLVVTKTRAAFLADAVIRKPGEDLGVQLAEWLAGDGPADPPPVAPVAAPARNDDPDAVVAWVGTQTSVGVLTVLRARLAKGTTLRRYSADERAIIDAAIGERLAVVDPDGIGLVPSPDAVYPPGHNRYHGD